MSDKLKKLKDLGAQKISEDTHIPVWHIEAILDENYEGFTRIQFFGFLSILEREYDIDVSNERAAAKAYYDENSSVEPLAENGVLVLPEKEKNFTPLYILIVIAIFLGALYYTFNNVAKYPKSINMTMMQKQLPVDTNKTTTQTQLSTAQEKNSTKQQIFKTSITSIKRVVVDKNSTVVKVAPTKKVVVTEEKNMTIESKKIKQQVKKFGALEILPRSKVWLGYIEVPTNIKHQKVFSNKLDLDGNKEWLLVSGHGNIDVIAAGKKTRFSSKSTLRLHYKDGKLEKISVTEFKRLNRGRKW